MFKFYYLSILLLLLGRVSAKKDSGENGHHSGESGENGESNRVQVKVGCQNKNLILSCRNSNEIINIVYANYGRLGRPYCPISGQNNNAVCTTNTTTAIVSQRCNGTTSCTIPVNNNQFGDTCNGPTNYLAVAYTCSKYVRACENNTATITCPPGQVIIVTNANYGRTSTSPCTSSTLDTTNTYCVSSNATQIAANTCDLRQSCTLPASSSIYGDSCPGTYKYLEVQYYCARY